MKVSIEAWEEAFPGKTPAQVIAEQDANVRGLQRRIEEIEKQRDGLAAALYIERARTISVSRCLVDPLRFQFSVDWGLICMMSEKDRRKRFAFAVIEGFESGMRSCTGLEVMRARLIKEFSTPAASH